MDGQATEQIRQNPEPQFKERTKHLAETLDPRIKSIGAMFAAAGLSIGVIMLVMPCWLSNRRSPHQYGIVVGAFAATKMLGNIPAANMVEKFGRKRILTFSIATIGASMAGIGLASDFNNLALCRACTGLGVSLHDCSGCISDMAHSNRHDPAPSTGICAGVRSPAKKYCRPENPDFSVEPVGLAVLQQPHG